MNFIINNNIFKRLNLNLLIGIIFLPVVVVTVFFPKPIDSSNLRYLLFIISFPITTLITYFSLKKFIASVYICFLYSIAYTFMSWHFLKFYTLSSCFYFFLPYVISCLIYLTLDYCVPVFKSIVGLILVELYFIVFQPAWGIVVFFLTIILAIYKIINRKRFDKWFIFIMILPVFSFITKGLSVETYSGIKLVELFIPLKNGYLDIFSRIYTYFDTHLVQYEVFHVELKNYGHLGLLFSITFLSMLFSFFFRNENEEVVNFCYVIIICLIFFFIFRGLTGVIYYIYKGFANYEAFILVIAFLLCITGGRTLEKMMILSNKFLFYGITSFVLLFSIITSIPRIA